MRKDVVCCVVCDASFLKWKYVDQPGQTFVRRERFQGETVGGLAVLAMRKPDGTYLYRRAFLMEIVAPVGDGDVLPQLVRPAIATAAERHADSLVCMHLSTPLTRALEANGFHLRTPKRLLLVDADRVPAEEAGLVLAANN